MREVRLGDEFAEGVLEVDLGHRPIHDLLANLAYGREVENMLRKAVCFIEQRNVKIVFGSTRHNLRFLVWMDQQEAFSREWYLGQIYWRYMSIVAAAVDLFEGNEPAADAVMTLAYETMGLGALCREYELSDQHKNGVLVREKQLRGFNSHEASAQRAEARNQRQAEAELWQSVARETAAGSRLRGVGLENEIRKELKRRGINKSPSGRSIRAALKRDVDRRRAEESWQRPIVPCQ